MIGTLTELQSHLHAAGSEPQAIAALHTGMRETGDLVGILRRVVEDDATTQRVAEPSYRHPNGFDRIVLVDDGFERPKVRLHIWWPDQPAEIEQIHNHAWDFSSVLLAGTLHFELYDTLPEGARKLRYESLPPRRATSGYRLRYLGHQAVARSFDALLGQGTIYTLQHDAFHRVVQAGEGITATLVIHGPFVREHSEILADEPMNEQLETQVRHFSPDALRARLATLLDLMDH